MYIVVHHFDIFCVHICIFIIFRNISSLSIIDLVYFVFCLTLAFQKFVFGHTVQYVILFPYYSYIILMFAFAIFMYFSFNYVLVTVFCHLWISTISLSAISCVYSYYYSHRQYQWNYSFGNRCYLTLHNLARPLQ